MPLQSDRGGLFHIGDETYQLFYISAILLHGDVIRIMCAILMLRPRIG